MNKKIKSKSKSKSKSKRKLKGGVRIEEATILENYAKYFLMKLIIDDFLKYIYDWCENFLRRHSIGFSGDPIRRFIMIYYTDFFKIYSHLYDRTDLTKIHTTNQVYFINYDDIMRIILTFFERNKRLKKIFDEEFIKRFLNKLLRDSQLSEHRLITKIISDPIKEEAFYNLYVYYCIAAFYNDLFENIANLLGIDANSFKYDLEYDDSTIKNHLNDYFLKNPTLSVNIISIIDKLRQLVDLPQFSSINVIIKSYSDEDLKTFIESAINELKKKYNDEEDDDKYEDDFEEEEYEYEEDFEDFEEEDKEEITKKIKEFDKQLEEYAKKSYILKYRISLSFNHHDDCEEKYNLQIVDVNNEGESEKKAWNDDVIKEAKLVKILKSNGKYGCMDIYAFIHQINVLANKEKPTLFIRNYFTNLQLTFDEFKTQCEIAYRLHSDYIIDKGFNVLLVLFSLDTRDLQKLYSTHNDYISGTIKNLYEEYNFIFDENGKKWIQRE